ncbi:hypothetical protein EG68_05612 [Paragonimus skrjabini miyazakii]|uniref:Uncharacterized protein n=1 Tax=Paragonimus skrjabini miyazakii TaxID=59628 RepID=A0A8S9YGV0_9TREM|nr:hypothetical protein EG68_05612 [Paragonimus skrjabini miyazakii]
MRIATYSGFRPTIQPPIVYGTIQLGKLKTENRMKNLQGSQRFWMLITSMCRVSATPNRPRQGSKLKTSHPVAFFILPSWQFPLKMGYSTIHENENSLRKAFIYVFGLAISLVSLSALRMFDWFRWPYQSTPGDDSHFSSNPEDLPVLPPDDVIWTQTQSCLDVHRTPRTPPARYRSHSEKLSDPKSKTNSDSRYGTNYSTSVPSRWDTPLHSAKNDPAPMDPVIEVETPSPFSWTNAAMSCAHFTSGFAQVCPLCWLNLWEGWVFGPTLNPFDRAIRECLDDQARLDTSLATATRIAKIPCKTRSPKRATGMGSKSSERRVVISATQATPCSNSSVAPLKRRFSSVAEFGPVDSLTKHPRSSGDGAPSTTSNDMRAVTRDMTRKPNLSHSTANSPVSLVPGDVSTLRIPLKTDLGSVDRRFPIYEYPYFFVPTSENDTDSLCSRMHPTSKVGGSVSSENGKHLEIELRPPPFGVLMQRIHSDPLSRKYFYDHNRETNPTATPLDRSASLISSRNDEFEYDELFSDHVLSPQKGSAYLTGEPESSVEESRFLNLMDVTSFLLDPQTTGDGANESLRSPASSQLQQRSHSECKHFVDLAQKATELSADLSYLEEVLDRLHYKLQATRIGLDHAEDNLDFVWHLRDNLEGGSDTDSVGYSQCYSESQNSLNTSLSFATEPSPSRGPVPSTAVLFHADHPTGHVDLSGLPDCQSSCDLSPEIIREHSVLCASVDQVSTPLYASVGCPSHLPITSVSEVDSGLEPSRSLCSSLMVTSLPAASLSDSFTTDCRRQLGQSPLQRTRLRRSAKRYYGSRKRFTAPSYSADLIEWNRMEGDEAVVDADGFVYPELTFDKDGIIDWVGSVQVKPNF